MTLLKSAGEMKKILDWLNSSVDSETISFEQLTDAIKGYGTAMDEAKEKTDAIKSAFSGLYDIQQKIKNSQFGVGDLDATESKIESILQLSKFFGDNKDLMDNLVDKNGNINLNTEAFKQATLKELDKRIEAANQTGGAAATALANSLSSDKCLPLILTRIYQKTKLSSKKPRSKRNLMTLWKKLFSKFKRPMHRLQ